MRAKVGRPAIWLCEGSLRVGRRYLGIRQKAGWRDEKVFKPASSPVSTHEGERILCLCTASTNHLSAERAPPSCMTALPLSSTNRPPWENTMAERNSISQVSCAIETSTGHSERPLDLTIFA